MVRSVLEVFRLAVAVPAADHARCWTAEGDNRAGQADTSRS